ncbi:hypothetical protein C7T94_15235 [Pedobacter yulinensis]|uniref:DUF3352 domain-containing protein n=1 Tax=Pedobacter yulinensis TaxID=2126353 RepID=A0A2T3HI81_9SPHI|nr:hypothetical protein [Pedobacter yulinensis]PST82155.1 hypothetical protein C7T94_15235 [Pedobacter yulinensis]
MKKFIILLTLFAGITALMAYLYFSRLNRESDENNLPLIAMTEASGFIFRFQHDRSFYDIMKGQTLFSEVLGERKTAELQAIGRHFLDDPEIGRLFGGQLVYAGLIPGREKSLDLLFTTRMAAGAIPADLEKAWTRKSVRHSLSKGVYELTLGDSLRFYLALRNQLVVFSSNRSAVHQVSLSKMKGNDFATYIAGAARFNRNTLANLFINYGQVPPLLKQMVAGSLNGELAVLDKQPAFAALSYNFSKERLAFFGNTRIQAEQSFLQLFSGAQPKKMTISGILPENTANYTLYAIPDYRPWRKRLEALLKHRRQLDVVHAARRLVSDQYRIDPERTFPAYFKEQMVSFQLSTGEKLAAVDLKNGEKLAQLLIEMSGDYADEVKILKDPGLLYGFFGEPFKRFERPYYAIIDNYFICANAASTIQSFLNSYRNNRLLRLKDNYTRLFDQLPNTASIVFYINQNNSADIFRQNLYLPFYRQLRSANGLKDFTSFAYLLSGEGDGFQTNVVLDKRPALAADSTLNQH